MTRIFISYDRADDGFAHRIADDLRANGFNVWRDVDDIPVGVEWETVTNTALKQCDVMLLVISPDSMTSDCVAHQWKQILRHNKRIIPLLYRTAELPSTLQLLHPIDFHMPSLLQKGAFTVADPYQLAFCALQTAICQQNHSTTHRLGLTGRHIVFDG
jgi:hypothetical protein